MKLERMNFDAALELAKRLPFAYITELSQFHFGATPETLEPAEWAEAHFFDGTRELRFLPEEDALVPTLLTEESDDRFVDEIPGFMASDKSLDRKSILIRKYIRTDEDGQAYIAAVRFTVKEDAE